MRSHFFTKLDIPINLPKYLALFFCINGRWSSQPKNVTVNTDIFSWEGLTSTYNGPNAHSPRNLMQASSVVLKVQHFKIDCTQYISQQQSISSKYLVLFQQIQMLKTTIQTAQKILPTSTASQRNKPFKPTSF